MAKGQDKGKYHEHNYYYASYDKMLSTIHVKIVEIKQNYNYLVKRYDEVEKAHQDLLHYIEFANLNTVAGYKIMKKLKDVRIERRLLKSELEECKIAYELVNNMVVDQLLKQVQQGISDCKKNQLTFDNRYTPRNTDLTGIDREHFDLIQDRFNQDLKENVVIFK